MATTVTKDYGLQAFTDSVASMVVVDGVATLAVVVVVAVATVARVVVGVELHTLRFFKFETDKEPSIFLKNNTTKKIN